MALPDPDNVADAGIAGVVHRLFVRNGLASGVWSQTIDRCLRMMRAVKSGVVWINTYRQAAPQLPFGGIKDSGYGRVRGAAGIREWMQTKTVFIDYSGDRRDPFSMKF